MENIVVDETYVTVTRADALDAAKSLIAVSSILVAASDQYAHTGSLSVGAVLHAAHVVDAVILRLRLDDLVEAHPTLPF